MRSEESKNQRRAYTRQWKLDHPDRVAVYAQSPERKAYLQAYYIKHKDQYRERERVARETDPLRVRSMGAARVRAARQRDPIKARYQSLQSQLKAKGKIALGLSLEEFRQWWGCQDRAACHICRKPFANEGRAIAVDHDHLTGQIRGLLCHGCNKALYHFDHPELFKAALVYLKRL